MQKEKAILVIGAGDATGGAIARRFAREGYVACVARRNADKLEPLVTSITADGGRGTILFTGATASLRGREGFSAFSGAKHALRALAQSMARELWPQGIHVAHVVIDGAIDTEWIRENFPQRYAMKSQQGILGPDSIAQTYWQIHNQPRDAWTHETELRPWTESW